MSTHASSRLRRFRPLLAGYLLAVLVLNVAGTGPRFRQLQTLTTGSTTQTGQLSPADALALNELGLSGEFYATYFTGLELLSLALFSLLALILLWKRPGDRMAVLFALAMGTLGPTTTPFLSGLAGQGAVFGFLHALLQSLGWTLFNWALFVFPDGRFVPRWSRWLLGVWFLYVLVALLVPPLRFQASLVWETSLEALLILWAFSWLLMAAALQLYRFRRAATLEARLQTRWVVYGLGLMVGLSFAGTIPLLLLPLLDAARSTIMAARLLAFSIALFTPILWAFIIAIAILRYRLFEIDVVVRRTLAYAILSTLLVLMYGISVVLLQRVVGTAGGQQHPVTIVLSTLLIAALFNPLRLHIQSFIDRRFFRPKVDSQAVLARFARVARDEVAPEALTAELTHLIRDSIQPETVDLWFKSTGKPTNRR